MSNFAKVENGFVTDIIVAEQDVIDSGLFGDPALWIQTSYNTYGNIHYSPNSSQTPDGGIALRANYAGIGYTYDQENDVFYAPRPTDINNVLCNSWTLSTETWLWTPPTPMPTDREVYWDETKQEWVNFDV